MLGLTPSATPSAKSAERVVLPEASAPVFKTKTVEAEDTSAPWSEDDDNDMSYFDRLKALANED